MILVRSPLRITLGGGGTDLPVYANEHGGFCLTAAITQYVYVSVIRPFEPGIYLKYSEIEQVCTIDQVQHPIIRQALQMLNVPAQVEITTLADIPSGTGLGSSSSFTTALLEALTVFQDRHPVVKNLAEVACELEINRLRAPIGPQDQYAAAYGGLLALTIGTNGSVTPCRLEMPASQRQALEDRLLLYFTGYIRDANAILRGQSVDSLPFMKEMGTRSAAALQAGDWELFGHLLDLHWARKRQWSAQTSNPQIDAWYELGRQHGAIGGKLVGAGGGGCLLFLSNDPQKLRAGLKDSGLKEIRFRFDTEGTKVLQT
jgi:D-glycero-alpha-D-manno-heptose-7-phosphate kinase